jgi:hypothetical protein
MLFPILIVLNPCPDHPDKHPSFSFRKSAEGRIQFICFRGCKIDNINDSINKLRIANGSGNGTDAVCLMTELDREKFNTTLRKLNKQLIKALAPKLLNELSDNLSIPVEALHAFDAGWSEQYKCWSFPMRDASNLYQMGPLLKEIAKVCLDAGATPLLVHHCKMGSGMQKKKPDLSDLAFAGIQEFVRQWLLIGRRNQYVPGSGHHDLWLAVGGSAGQSGEWPFTVREGRLNKDFTGRYWKTSFPSPEELATQRNSRNQNKDRETTIKGCKKVMQALKQYPEGETKTVIYSTAKLSNSNGGKSLELLVRKGRVKRCKVVKNGKNLDGYCSVPKKIGANQGRQERSGKTKKSVKQVGGCLEKGGKLKRAG